MPAFFSDGKLEPIQQTRATSDAWNLFSDAKRSMLTLLVMLKDLGMPCIITEKVLGEASKSG